MEIFLDPTIWMGLLTLIIIEVVLGIDNLVFIAILADKLPEHQRDKARIIGLSLALVMRLALLATISWIVTLTQPFLTVFEVTFSVRDLIMLGGGLFLIFKATMELHERLEGESYAVEGKPKVYPKFAAVIAQIVVLDAVFSIDSVITAVGMVEHLEVMMAAVVIAVLIMMVSSKPLTRFVNAHATVVILCLGFLLMIGFSLVAEGFGLHIPKGYLYAAIGFSVLIEAINQLAFIQKRRSILATKHVMRVRTTDAVLRLLGMNTGLEAADITALASTASRGNFLPEERAMIRGVFTLSERSIASIMTPRHEVDLLRIEEENDVLLKKVVDSTHSRLVLVEGDDLSPVGIVYKKDILHRLINHEEVDLKTLVREPLFVPESTKVLGSLNMFRDEATFLAIIVNEYGDFMGIITPTDILEAIAGDLPDEDEKGHRDIEAKEDGSFVVDGGADIHDLEMALKIRFEDKDDFHTAAGFILDIMKRIPQKGDKVSYGEWDITVTKTKKNRVMQLVFKPRVDEDEQVAPPKTAEAPAKREGNLYGQNES